MLVLITYPEEQGTAQEWGGGGGAGGGGGGGTLIFSYTRRLRPFLGVQKFNFSMFWGFQRNEYIWGYEFCGYFFFGGGGGYHIIGLYLRVNSIHLRVFSFGQGT